MSGPITQSPPLQTPLVDLTTGKLTGPWSKFFTVMNGNIRGNLDTFNLADGAATYEKLQETSSGDILLGRNDGDSGVVQEVPITSFGRSLLTTTNMSDPIFNQGTMASQNSNNVTITGGSVSGISLSSLTSALALSSGGVGATTATGARLNLGIGNTLLNYVVNITGAVATGTTVFGFGAGIPTNTLGDQYMAITYTPKSESSTLLIISSIFFTSSVINNINAALFRDSTANAIVSGTTVNRGAGDIHELLLICSQPSNSVIGTTIKLRAGGASAGTTTFNGTSGSVVYGGTLGSGIIILEIG